ncbi:MAG: SAM-dependent DNA methyltransferase [Bacteroidales bacterium]|nr:SAM-dependent DNA methyltransferase [Bacteroidales bacterium]
MTNFQDKANFIWSIADYLRGDYKQAEYGKVILPLTVLRRLDCLLTPNKKEVLSQYEKVKKQSEDVIDRILNQKSGYDYFHNHSPFDFEKLLGDPNNIAANLRNYIAGFSANIKEVFENFRFDEQIKRLDDANLLYKVMQEFNSVDLSLSQSLEMGYIFEHLIRKFAEASNETAGEHFTPREVIRLMVHLLFAEDDDIFKEGTIKEMYDPACGTGGMLSIAEDYFKAHNNSPSSQLNLYGQELNPESYAICKADMMIKGQNPGNIKQGNSFTQDGLSNEKFHYMLSNPPFGVNWKKVQSEIQDEYEKLGFAGRFGAGLPSVSDGSLLFLLHMISKMKDPKDGGSRLAIVFNGSPLFTGGAGSGVSSIRKWIIENDLLEGIVALPDQLFYNTGISTYVWVLSNRKSKKRQGKIQLVNATSYFQKMKRSLGNKRNEISDKQIEKITRIYCEYKDGEYSKIFDREDFGYTRVQVDRPQKDEKGNILTDAKKNPKPDSSLRDYENVPLKQDIEEYFKQEVLPHVPDAWMDRTNDKIGYEINFTRYFYKYQPLRSLEEIRADILKLEKETVRSIKSITDD